MRCIITLGLITSTLLFGSVALGASRIQLEITGLVAGVDGNVWFSATRWELEKRAALGVPGNGFIGRITPTGKVDEFPIQLPDTDPTNITRGPDGNLWFIGASNSHPFNIGRIDKAGTISLFPIPCKCEYYSMTVGPGKKVYLGGQSLAVVTLDGASAPFPVGPPFAGALNLLGAPDGNLWFTGPHPQSIGRISPTAEVQTFALPPEGERRIGQMIAASDGNLWFTQSYGGIREAIAGRLINKVGRMTLAGIFTEFVVPGSANNIVEGPDHNLWISSGQGIFKMSDDGALTPFKTPHGAGALSFGADGSLWFVERPVDEQENDGLAKMSPSGEVTEFPVRISL